MTTSAPAATPATPPATASTAAQAHRAGRRWWALGLAAGGLISCLTGCADGPPVLASAASPAAQNRT